MAEHATIVMTPTATESQWRVEPLIGHVVVAVDHCQ